MSCVPHPGPPAVSHNDTCIYVTLTDQFGDGWTDSVNFYYWAEIHNFETNVIMESLNCSCRKMAGCIHPSSSNIDKRYYLTVMGHDEVDGRVDFVPPHAWEIQWTAQIVEDGVWKEKYYGGLNSSFVFDYSRLEESFEMVMSENAWVIPEECHSCASSS
ncbi:unnamed protein product, partial [Symbiodinium microadriaticum]